MPISNHRLFPALVALWFGALFGLSCLAVRPGLLETLVVFSQFDRIMPAAAPPLGDTARILIALTMAALGALLGAVIGTRIARVEPAAREEEKEEEETNPNAYTIEDADTIEDTADQSSPDARSDTLEYQPVSAHQETGGASPETAPQETGSTPLGLGSRRRSLSLPEHEDRDEYPELTLLPSGGPQILNIAEIDFDPPTDTATSVDHDRFDDAPVAEHYAPSVPEEAMNAVADADYAAQDDATQTADIESLDMVSLAERLVQSMEHRRGRADAGVVAKEIDAILSEEPEEAQFEALGAPEQAGDAEVPPAPMALPDAMRPISLDYGWDDERYVPPPLTPAADFEATANQPEDATEDEAEETIDEDIGYSSLLSLSRTPERRPTFARIEGEPAALEPAAEPVVIFPGQAARAAAAAMPLQGPAATLTSPAQTGSDTETPEDGETGSASGEVSSIAPAGLRRFGTPASAEQEQPATRDQDQAVQDSAETERALRDALVSLQRMTGTA